MINIKRRSFIKRVVATLATAPILANATLTAEAVPTEVLESPHLEFFGEWSPSAVYHVGDIVTMEGHLYVFDNETFYKIEVETDDECH